MKIKRVHNFKLESKEIAKINEVLELSEKEVLAIKKSFTSAFKTDDNTIIVKDWMDDSIQVVKIRKS